LEYIPAKGPLIVASNHPSAFLEASILGTILGRPLHYLVRGDMFHPRFSWLFDVTNQIPIYRQKDGISNLRKNASSFELTYRKLADGEAVVIFPEAKTILEKRMRPIQRGTAHLAFGTLPFLRENEQLSILPVGVNFTEPRLPGTDVVVRFGRPFITEQATREDREAIDRFTEQLSESMSPLIVQIDDEGYEKHYDVLASVYLRCNNGLGSAEDTHDHLVRISKWVNGHDEHKQHLKHIHQHIHLLKQGGLQDLIYFPDLILKSRLMLLLMFVVKLIWLLAGGWIWRGLRNMIFSKIKPNTFKSPVTVGAAMVIYPLVTLILLIICLSVGWPIWYVLIWLGVMVAGIFFRPSLGLIGKALTLDGASKQLLKKDIQLFKEELQEIIAGGKVNGSV
jgi:1-acyl-sn-glycerol-3-phosphate acyltransferase